MSPPHTARYLETGAKQRPAGLAEPGHKTPDGGGSPVWVVAVDPHASPPWPSPAGNPDGQICAVDPRGRRTQKRPTMTSPRLLPPRQTARRNGEHERHLLGHLLVLHFDHLKLLLALRLVRRDIMRLEVFQAMLASEPREGMTGTAGQRMFAALHRVIRPQTLEAQAVGISTRN